MLWVSSFKITDQVVADLEQIGLDDGLVRALRGKASNLTLKRADLENMLDGLGNQNLGAAERKLIRKYSRLSLLRLERFIPNRGVREWIDALVYAVIIALVVRQFAFSPFRIPSASMYPTIKAGDRIFAKKFSYGLPVPFTEVKLIRQPVERGDIVIFPYPRNPSEDYIKRVVGLGGETVEIRASRVFINGNPLNEPYAYYDPQVLEEMQNGGQSRPSFGPVSVPEGHLFVMGDNRFHSADSRYWGFVNERTVKGRGWIIFFSHDTEGGWFSGYRVGRIGMVLR